jgi:hypothetical protein
MLVADGGLDHFPTLNVLHRVLDEGCAGFACDLITGIDVITGKDDLRTFAGHALNGGLADAVGATGDEGNFVLQPVTH